MRAASIEESFLLFQKENCDVLSGLRPRLLQDRWVGRDERKNIPAAGRGWRGRGWFQAASPSSNSALDAGCPWKSPWKLPKTKQLPSEQIWNDENVQYVTGIMMFRKDLPEAAQFLDQFVLQARHSQMVREQYDDSSGSLGWGTWLYDDDGHDDHKIITGTKTHS